MVPGFTGVGGLYALTSVCHVCFFVRIAEVQEIAFQHLLRYLSAARACRAKLASPVEQGSELAPEHGLGSQQSWTKEFRVASRHRRSFASRERSWRVTQGSFQKCGETKSRDGDFG